MGLSKRTLTVGAFVAAGGAVFLGSSFAGGPTDVSGAGSGPRPPYVLLTSGTFQGEAWRLFAWESGGQLCLFVYPGGSDPEHLPSAASEASGGGGCGFDDKPSGGYSVSGLLAGGGSASFGPLPVSAVRIQVAQHKILSTSKLPAVDGLPAGRYWMQILPAGPPPSADGTYLDNPQPLDSAGKPVAFQDF